MFSFFAYGNSKSAKLNILYYSILCYIASLFFKGIPAITNILMVWIFLLAVVNFKGKNYLSAFSENRVNIGIVLFIIYHFISLAFSVDKNAGMEVLSRRIPLLVLPAAFCLISFEAKAWYKLLIFYAFATTIASLAGFSYGVYLNLKFHDTGYLYNDNISAFLLGKQSVYFSFYVNCAIFIFTYFLLEKIDFVKKIKSLIIFSIIWLIFICFMLACKTAMLGLFIILLWTVTGYLIRKRKFFEIIIISFALVVAIFLAVKVSPKTLNRFKGITQTDFQYDNKNKENHFNAEYDESKWGSTNTRIAIWSCAIEVWKEHPVFGTGIGGRDAALNAKYKEKQFWYALSTEKHTHNQYLDIGISMGAVGEIIFLFLFLIYPLKIFLKQKQALAISIFAFLAICFFTENMLNRYQGEILIAFILPLVSKIKDKMEI
ncbi:MAG: O-antigen ligase family protein [Bacteroidetes bacterium]|nr:O-antigen ligase family protein [Bacteroidota bacterium]